MWKIEVIVFTLVVAGANWVSLELSELDGAAVTFGVTRTSHCFIRQLRLKGFRIEF